MSKPAYPDIKNRILAALPREEYEQLLPKLKHVPLEYRKFLFEPDQRIEHVYFPSNGIASLLNMMEHGEIAEVGMVGYEGMIGLPVFLGDENASNLAMVQVGGEGMQMKTKDFREAVSRSSFLHHLLLRYTQALMMQISQTAACNNFHSAEERFCRWILMTHDRAKKDTFPMTQEFLSEMLAVRRPTISVVAGLLQRAELIRYSRGKMTILNREGLEKGSCECYRVVRNSFDRLNESDEGKAPGERRR